MDKQPFSSVKMLHRKAFGCFNMQGEAKKIYFHFSNPQTSVENHKTCKAWLENLRMPRKVENNEWKISHHVCEDHFSQTASKSAAFSGSVAVLLNFAGKRFSKRDSIADSF